MNSPITKKIYIPNLLMYILKMKQRVNCHRPSKQGGKDQEKVLFLQDTQPTQLMVFQFHDTDSWAGGLEQSFLKVAQVMMLKKVGSMSFFPLSHPFM